MEKIISVKNLRKAYKKETAVQNVCFELVPGNIMGLLGTNGAGKTTILNSHLSLTLLYSFDLLNGIGFLKDFRVASPQRGSWQSQRRDAKRLVDVCLAPTGSETG